MKRTLRTILICGAMLALLCISAWATGAGITDLTVSGVTATLYDAANTEVTKDGECYPLADKVKISYSAAENGKYYAAFLLTGDSAVPTASNLVYIDQAQADSNGVAFTLYPNTLTEGTEYHAYLSSNATSGITTLTEVASFAYTNGVLLGDVNGDGTVAASDASLILQNVAKIISFSEKEKSAADVNNDGSVAAADASYVLQKVAKIIDDFSEISK